MEKRLRFFLTTFYTSAWTNPVNGRTDGILRTDEWMDGRTKANAHFCNSMYFGSEICMVMDAIHGHLVVFGQLGFRDHPPPPPGVAEYSGLWAVLKIHVVTAYYCNTHSIVHGF